MATSDTSEDYQGPPPLDGWVECPAGSGHWVQGTSCGTSNEGEGETQEASGNGGSVTNLNEIILDGLDPALPVSDFTYTVYANGLVEFVANTTGNVSAYYWDSGDGHYSRSKNFTRQYTSTGTMVVSLTVANTAGMDTKTKNVAIASVPVAETVDFTYAIGNLSVKFTDTSTKSGTRYWNFGDGDVSNEKNPYHPYDTPGIYSPSLSIGGITTTYQLGVDYGIVLVWHDNSSNEDGFKIEHCTDGASWALIETVAAGVTTTTITWNIHGVDPAVTNFFRVYAYNAVGDSATTNEVETLCGA